MSTAMQSCPAGTRLSSLRSQSSPSRKSSAKFDTSTATLNQCLTRKLLSRPRNHLSSTTSSKDWTTKRKIRSMSSNWSNSKPLGRRCLFRQSLIIDISRRPRGATIMAGAEAETDTDPRTGRRTRCTSLSPTALTSTSTRGRNTPSPSRPTSRGLRRTSKGPWRCLTSANALAVLKDHDL